MSPSDLNLIIVNLVFFVYKVGESMLDTTTKPYLVSAVCYDTYLYKQTENMTCKDLEKNPALEDHMQSLSGNYLIYYRLLLNIPAIPLALLCGSYSDRYGRKIPIFLPSVGSVFAVMLYILSDLVPLYRIPLIFCGIALQGLFGKSSVITMAVNSMVCDISLSGNRTRILGILLAMNFLGVCVGSLLSGLIQSLFDLSVTFFCVTILHGMSILFTIFLIDETVGHSKEQKSKITKCEVCEIFRPSNFKDAITVVTRPRFLNDRKIIIVLLVISLVTQICRTGESDINLLFITRRPLSWPKPWYGYLLSLEYAVKGVCLFLFLPLFSNQLMLSDVTIVMLGIICKLVRLVWAGFCNTTWMVFVSVAIGAMAGMTTSALRSLASKAVDGDEAGKMFAILTAAETSSKFLGSLIFLNIYGVTAHFFPGIAFLIEAFVYLCLLLVLIVMFRPLKKLQSSVLRHISHSDYFSK
ncbi:proton-coupled folate transporter-like [Saccostrea echinata]|uniref:proton-coupled folate transporter-like n=1 Tax=Saccostrea echinata TaxID=191078 RepID=UPI002A830656|nr:proton-coupled folate transporter-like [Saccostrea echinata]